MICGRCRRDALCGASRDFHEYGGDARTIISPTYPYQQPHALLFDPNQVDPEDVTLRNPIVRLEYDQSMSACGHLELQVEILSSTGAGIRWLRGVQC